ncbi:dihydrodipicolinate synthase family protein [bacterium]|nr:dihydrodipicolinate synthase family protein [bacterium]
MISESRLADTNGPFEPRGVIPACLLPFTESLNIDEAAYRKHLRDLAAIDGISAITINGHAAEVHALTFDEQRRLLDITKDELGGSMPIVAGVAASGSLEAARLAAMATSGGADCLLVFPPESMTLGGQRRPEMAIEHFRRIVDATDLPIILFQYSMGSGLGYPLDTLLRLCECFRQIRAIKDWCNDPPLHERQIRELHALNRPVNVLSTHSAWLLGSLAMGCDGLLSGAGSVVADLQVKLWRAVQSGDLAAAQAVNDRLYPTVQAFYHEPLLDMHNRMKEALVLLGRLEAAFVRPPLIKLSDSEITEIRELLTEAKLRH